MCRRFSYETTQSRKKGEGECWCSRIASPYPRASVERRALPCPSGDSDLTTTPVVCESPPQAQRGRLPLQSRLIRRQGGDGDPRRARRRLNYRRDKRGGDRHPSSLHFMTGGGEGDGLRRLIRRQGGDGDPRRARSRLIHRHGGDGHPRRTRSRLNHHHGGYRHTRRAQGRRRSSSL